jgi:very-short-patch-repair endonuclease
MGGLPDPDWYFEHVLYSAEPGGAPVVVGPAAEWLAWWRGRRTDDPVVQRAARHGFVLERHELAELGISESAARTELRRGRWTRARHGAVAPLDLRADLPEQAPHHVLVRRHHAVECAAAALRRTAHVVSARSAAVLHGLPTRAVPDRPELTAAQPVRLGRRTGAHVHGATLSSSDVEHWFGVPVTCVSRTLVDLARHDRRDAIMAADAALRERLVRRSDIDRALTHAYGWPGVRQARAVLALTDPRAESPLESLLRLALHDDRFPPPDLQVRLGRDRVDMYWPRHRLVVEADGRAKYTDDQLWQEKKREQRLRARGEQVERVIWTDLGAGWRATRARLWTRLGG